MKDPRPAVPYGKLARADGARPRLLLADDSATARELMKALLEQMGCSVDAVDDGHEAVAHARRGTYDAILMDIEMPVLDGLSAALEIRRLEAGAARIPIIALSALIADISSQPILAAAFDRSIVKPASRADLHGVLAPIVEIDRHATDAGSLDAMSAGDVPPDPLDRARLGDILHGLKPSRRRALQDMAAGELAGLTAELSAAVKAGASGEITRLAHKIRGTAANFAAVQLASAAADLEADCATGLPADIAHRSAALEAAAAATIAALGSLRGPAQPQKARQIG